MPELPEVETIKRELDQGVRGKDIQEINRIDQLNSITTEIINQKESTINSITRYGKYLLFNLSNDNTIIVHLRMTGQFFINPNEKEKELDHVRVSFQFKDKTSLKFRDFRRFATMEIVKTNKISDYFLNKKIGPDALKCEYDMFVKNLQNKKRSEIKTALLDQKVVAGIGNIYAQEMCFKAKVAPTRKISSLTSKEIKLLFENMHNILNDAIKFNGTTFDGNYVNTNGESGEFFEFLSVYGQHVCKKCNGKIEKIKLGGRSTNYCPKCQT
jgi:formamidopyrimidine-DNA glycosylase